MAEASTSATPDTPTPKIRHEWYQTDNEVNVSIFVKNVKADDLKVDLHLRSVSVNIRLPTGSDLVFDLDPLSHEIDPSRSSFRPLTTKVELRLSKAKAAIKWAKLEGEEAEELAMTGTSERKSGPSYPTSAKRKTNWDALAQEVKKEEDKPADPNDPNSGGDQQLNKLFQKLYGDATEDQRKAMIKSYQESNGTSLSTNWDDVKKKRVETMPPDSMVAKKWEN